MTPPERRVLVKLQRTLGALSAPWTVVCNRGAGDNAPPWVRYLALHPEKGVALIDIAPAQPILAIAPLEEFLARTGLGAFADGDPPIVAVALELRKLSAGEIEARLAEAFANTAPCGIANADWPNALIDLLMMTRGLALTRLKRLANPAIAESESALEPILAATEGMPPLALADDGVFEREPSSEADQRAPEVEGRPSSIRQALVSLAALPRHARAAVLAKTPAAASADDVIARERSHALSFPLLRLPLRGIGRAFASLTALSRRAGTAATAGVAMLIAALLWLSRATARALEAALLASAIGSRMAWRWSPRRSRRASALALLVLRLSMIQMSEWRRAAARWIAAAVAAIAATSRVACDRTAAASKLIAAAVIAGSRAATVRVRQGSGAAAALIAAGSSLVYAAALPGARRSFHFVRHAATQLALRWPILVSALWQRVSRTPELGASFAVMALFGALGFAWATYELPAGTPPSDASAGVPATEAPAEASVRERLTASAFLGDASLAIDQPTSVAIDAPPILPTAVAATPEPIEFEIGGVPLRFDPPASYCVFPDALLQNVLLQQGRINPANVVHTVFGDCDELHAAAESQTRIQNYGMLMTPKAQLDRRMTKATLKRLVASAADDRFSKKTLAERLHQALRQPTLQSVSTLGILERDKDATYFAYLFKANVDDDGYTQACVMALTAVKGRLVSYYLYSDYTGDARATLMGLLQKVRAGVGDLATQNADHQVADRSNAPG